MSGVGRRTGPISPRVDDPDVDRVLRDLERRLRAIESAPIVQGNFIKGVELANNTEVNVSHKLGRTPNGVLVTPVQGASTSGRIIEQRGTSVDRSRFVQLLAVGFGATVTVDVWVY